MGVSEISFSRGSPRRTWRERVARRLAHRRRTRRLRLTPGCWLRRRAMKVIPAQSPSGDAGGRCYEAVCSRPCGPLAGSRQGWLEARAGEGGRKLSREPRGGRCAGRCSRARRRSCPRWMLGAWRCEGVNRGYMHAVAGILATGAPALWGGGAGGRLRNMAGQRPGAHRQLHGRRYASFSLDRTVRIYRIHRSSKLDGGPVLCGLPALAAFGIRRLVGLQRKRPPFRLALLNSTNFWIMDSVECSRKTTEGN